MSLTPVKPAVVADATPVVDATTATTATGVSNVMPSSKLNALRIPVLRPTVALHLFVALARSSRTGVGFAIRSTGTWRPVEPPASTLRPHRHKRRQRRQ